MQHLLRARVIEHLVCGASFSRHGATLRADTPKYWKEEKWLVNICMRMPYIYIGGMAWSGQEQNIVAKITDK